MAVETHGWAVPFGSRACSCVRRSAGMSQEGKSKSLSTKEMWGCIGSVLAGFVTGAFLLINTLIGTWGPRLPFFQAQASPTPVFEIASPSLESTLTPELASPTSPPADVTTAPTSLLLPSPTPLRTPP